VAGVCGLPSGLEPGREEFARARQRERRGSQAEKIAA
jgi:hypothetical protein